MGETERLYYTDSHLIEFEARVVGVTERVSGWSTVRLDRTAFYPTGGGQPSDTGTLGGARVVECMEDAEAGVLHLVQGAMPKPGSAVKGQIDWERRLDHIQQHTGQHILSQAFVALFGAETHGFRMMDRSSEVDIALADPSDERIQRAVDLANEVVWSDRPVRVHQVTKEEASQLPLRKDSAREGELRIIEIEGFDFSPCGGTHALRTGEVGLIAVRSWERAKGLARLEFVAGSRALADYRMVNRAAVEVASLFSVGRDESPISVARLIDENKTLHRRLRTLEELATRVEADELVKEMPPDARGFRVMSRIFDGRDANTLKLLGQCLIAHERVVALLGSRDGDAARLLFARSADAPGDMNALMHEACSIIDGRGGGRPDLAQGGGHNVERLGDAIASAERLLNKA